MTAPPLERPMLADVSARTLGILAFALSPVAAVPAAILAIVALVDSRRSDPAGPWAIGALVVSFLSTTVVFVVVNLLLQHFYPRAG